MYAIVEIAGQQYKVEKDQQLFVHRLEGKAGSKVSFDNVLLTSDGKKVEVGAPAVKGVSVSAKIVEHLKGDKVIVFKKKRRKGYKVRNGHRQYLSKIEIESIGAAKKSATKAKKAEDTEAKKETKKAAPKAEATKTTAKKETAKKAPAKKAAPKKESKAKSETAPKAKAKPAAKKAEDKKEEK
ncbi:MAG: 50S ribosomal protein L21 [Vicingaceae bacterium]